MRRIPLFIAALALATGCPKVQQKTYSFDLAHRTGELRFLNISTDDATKGDEDFMQVLNDVVEGSKLETEHPGWIIDSKELVAENGELNGIVRFHYNTPADASIYKHDKKSPYLFCVDSGATLISTDGKRIDDVLNGCVAWERKAKSMLVTFKDEEFSGSEVSLLPQFERWKAGEKFEASDNPFANLMSGLGNGGDPEAMGEEFATALMGGLTSAMGLSGELTIGEPTLSGGINAAQVTEALDAKTTLLLNTCYQVSAMTGEVPAFATVDFVVSAAGAAEQVRLSPSHDELQSCLSGILAEDTTFPALKAESKVSLPLTFTKTATE